MSDCTNVCGNWIFRHESSDLAKVLIEDVQWEDVAEELNVKTISEI